VLLDHGVLHSADLGGPESLHPTLPIRAGELGVKRTVIAQGLQVMLRVGLIEMTAAETGIRFQASDSAYSFVSILGADYATTLRNRVKWVVQHFPRPFRRALRSQMRTIFASWSEEFGAVEPMTGNCGTLTKTRRKRASLPNPGSRHSSACGHSHLVDRRY
jgi:hypothetical protein